MSWKESGPVSERMKFITLLQSGQRSMTSLCHEFGISRKTGYKFADRFEAEGLDGLKDRSRAPHVLARETPLEIQDLLIAARKSHPTWGPRKLKAFLEDKDPSLDLPYPSTIGDLLKREGMVQPRRRRHKPLQAPGSNRTEVTQPNQEWNADFKGEFRLGNGEYCFPLTVTDAFSRYLLEVRALKGTSALGARVWFERLFREFGLPQSIRTDNGCPFAGTGLGRLSTLSVSWIKLGIWPVRGRPHHPQDNGRHERMHRTLKAETTRPPASGHRRQQDRFESFKKEYNFVRPHEALGQEPPARIYRPSVRSYPTRILEVEYPSHYEVRKVGSGGLFGWHQQPVFITHSLVGERIGLVEVEDGLWKVYFAGLELGVLDQLELRTRKIGRVLPMSPV